MGKYRDLKGWVKSKDLAVWIYQITGQGRFGQDFGLRDQIRRAVVSISSNIAEGDELGTNAQAIRHFYIAKGSNAEVLTQSIIAFEIGYITQNQYQHIEQESNTIGKMLNRLIQSRRTHKSPTPNPQHPKPSTQNPKPSTQNPKPSTQNPAPDT
jgi:four helix bundle protein